MNYYNENNPGAAAWLRELIKAGEIPDGEIDTRNIEEVRPYELTGFKQQHFFAGIGGWPLALRLAGWPDDEPVRTASCPCQPFSQTGKQLGVKDKRHLWPVCRDLITFGEYTITLGEQVASPLGREWLAGIRADLEGLGYEVGAADLCAAGVRSPHIRQRLYWVAHRNSERRHRTATAAKSARGPILKKGGGVGRLVESDSPGWNARQFAGAATGYRDTVEPASSVDRLGNSNGEGPQRRDERIFQCDHQWPPGTSNLVVLCEDGKARRFEPGSFPLAHGISGRVGLLRGYGNAIVPHLAAEFIQAARESLK